MGGASSVEIMSPHHMRFYVKKGMARVQYKHYSQDPSGPVEETQCLQTLPSINNIPTFVKVFVADERELRALTYFIT
jgi:hypothetical protein